MADPNCATLTLIHYHGKYISCVMDSVDGAMTTALRVALDRFIISYLPALTTLVTLSIALLGWSVVIGKNESVMLKQVVVALLMTGFIYAAIVNFEVIFKVVHPVITQAPAELAGYLIPGMSPGTHADTIKANAYGTLDRMAGNVISNCWAMIQQPGKAVYNGEYSLGTLVGGAILGLCALVYLAVTAGFLVMNHVRAAFLLLFAPLFISFLLFAKTRGMTQQWIQKPHRHGVDRAFYLCAHRALTP